jgi:hypothetical protein
MNKRCNGNAIPVTGFGGPQDCRTSRLPHFLDNGVTDGSEVVSLTWWTPFNNRKIISTHFCQRRIRPHVHSAAERIRSIEKSNNLIGNRKRGLASYSIVPQSTTQPRAPINDRDRNKFCMMKNFNGKSKVNNRHSNFILSRIYLFHEKSYFGIMIFTYWRQGKLYFNLTMKFVLQEKLFCFTISFVSGGVVAYVWVKTNIYLEE